MKLATYEKIVISIVLLILGSLLIAVNNANDILSMLKFGFSAIIVGIILHTAFRKELLTFIKS